MPEDQHRRSKALSEYYNSPGRLAILRRKFDNVSRRDGEDPASFATKLDILAVWSFGEVGQEGPDPDGPGSIHPGKTRLWITSQLG